MQIGQGLRLTTREDKTSCWMIKLKNTRRNISRPNERWSVLQSCSNAGWVLPFFFVFLFSLMALNKLSAKSTQDTQVPATTTAAAFDSAFYARYPYVIVIDEGEDADISEEYFYRHAASVIFKVSRIDLPTGDKMLRELRDSVLPRISRDSLKVVCVKMRGAASPEGPEKFNRYLSEHRQKALYDYIAKQLQIPQGDSLLLETVTEDYTYLCKRMIQDGDPDAERVKQLFDEYMPRGQYAQLKRVLQSIDGGRLWRRMLAKYFPSLRAARVIIVCQRKAVEEVEPIEPIKPIEPIEPIEPIQPIQPIQPIEPIHIEIEPEPEPETYIERFPRRELLSVKTNMLFYGVYMPGYKRWCPIPNVAIEYYPLRGHFTFGASIDFPWWQNYWKHKYFQVRNYQLETRYYLRSGSINRRPEGKGAAFRGWYLQAYGHFGLFGICFNENKGWVGEGGGGGVGLGYVLPISKKGHWRLEFQLQAGVFTCKYDPYQFENPVNPNYIDHLYYYKWTQKPALFKRRQYQFTWIGPTRVGVTLSYDLLYRKARQKTDGVRCPAGTQPTKRYNPLVPYEKGGRQ